jgi:hypothetical protein
MNKARARVLHLFGPARFGIFAVSVLAGLFSGSSVAQVNIAITFDAHGCPDPNVANVTVARGKKITWQAYDTNGALSRQNFEIFFDPLNGATLKAPQGKVARPVDDKAPQVEYKYTVVGDGCEHKPHDPVIRVN